MPAVGPGTSIGGRYHLRQRLDHTERAERWEADDTTFGRRVWVTVLPADDPVAPAALDAARRASSLTDPRLLPILDAGDDDGLVHVVEEAPEGAATLTDLLGDGGLPAPEARRIVRDVAEVLERARTRGLHHLDLTPDDVLRQRDGAVKLRGLAVQAALRGRDDVSDADASRTDAAALTALLYAALTATWPGTGEVRLRPTPVVAGAPVAPSELVAAVPDDLEHLVVSGLGARRPDRPESPAAVASLLRAGDEPADPRPGQSSTGTHGASGSLGSPAPSDPSDSRDAPTHPAPAVSTAAPAPFALADDLRTDVDHPPSKAEAAALAAAGATAAGARAVVGGVGSVARSAARRAAARRAERHERQLDRQQDKMAGRVPFSTLATEADHRAEPVAPVFVNDVPTGTPSRRQSNFVLAVMAALVVLGLVLGVMGISAMVGNIRRQLDAPPVARTYTASAPAVTVTVGPDGKVVGRQTAAAPPPAGTPLPIVGVSAYDPEGEDHAENNDMVNNVRDGNPGTYWRSQRYKTDRFGNLKSGVGLAVFLGDTQSDLHQIKLVLPDSGGQDIEVYGSDTATKDGATQLGSVKGAKGEIAIPVQPGAGRHPYVIVWFTNSPEMFGGHYAALSEIALS
ncbi:hypothetical protein [Arsenicicoccus sp. oral taxon 190]|uniref:hypothetical protein n=1 Tax=Arsenicicoccus sp. oral taxon 190 TaxID=1658671 RepID=UPI00067A7B93|nr:hypothetical protein [Arsenicicoccus sp. oral taxon 190]